MQKSSYGPAKSFVKEIKAKLLKEDFQVAKVVKEKKKKRARTVTLCF